MSTSSQANAFQIGEIALSRLGELRFPPLRCPSVGPHDPPCIALINWGTCVYVFSALCHFRELLRSFVVLLKEGCHGGAIVIARGLFELAAHAFYVDKHLEQYLAASHLEQAWSFLSDVNLGSRHMRNYGIEQLGIKNY
jgi:hypothetical protein